MGPLATATDDKNPRANNPAYKHEPPVLDDDVSVGAGAVLLPGVHLYMGSVVGAGAVVTKDVHPNVTVVGNPAYPIQQVRDREATMRRLVLMFETWIREWARGS